MLKIAVGGANGRMGQLITQAVEADPDTQLIASVTKDQPIPTQDLNADVFIDFSTPPAAMEHLNFCLQNQIKMVIGVTGFNDAQKSLISQAAAQIPIVFSPNMSIGVNLIFKLLDVTSRALNNKAEIAISEIHHKHKKDAPSGTALKMGEVAAAAHHSPVSYSSLRIGEAIGEHTAIFALPGEHIEIKHKAFNRNIYALGAIEAAKWLGEQSKPGLYGMESVLDN